MMRTQLLFTALVKTGPFKITKKEMVVGENTVDHIYPSLANLLLLESYICLQNN